MDNNNKFDKVKYNNEYNSRNYKKMTLTLKPDDIQTIDNYVDDIGMSKAKFIIACCRYCIENNIDIGAFMGDTD